MCIYVQEDSLVGEKTPVFDLREKKSMGSFLYKYVSAF
jgi:hypothetical protein